MNHLNLCDKKKVNDKKHLSFYFVIIIDMNNLQKSSSWSQMDERKDLIPLRL